MKKRNIKIKVLDKKNKAWAIFSLGTGNGGEELFDEPWVLETLCFDCDKKDIKFSIKEKRDNYTIKIIEDN